MKIEEKDRKKMDMSFSAGVECKRLDFQKSLLPSEVNVKTYKILVIINWPILTCADYDTKTYDSVPEGKQCGGFPTPNIYFMRH